MAQIGPRRPGVVALDDLDVGIVNLHVIGRRDTDDIDALGHQPPNPRSIRKRHRSVRRLWRSLSHPSVLEMPLKLLSPSFEGKKRLSEVVEASVVTRLSQRTNV